MFHFKISEYSSLVDFSISLFSFAFGKKIGISVFVFTRVSETNQFPLLLCSKSQSFVGFIYLKS